MLLKHALRLSDSPTLALVGAGGKSTALFQLARQFSPPVLITATTHLSLEQAGWADVHLSLEQPSPFSPRGVTLVTGRRDEAQERTLGVDEAVLAQLRAEAQRRHLPLLIEADGSRRKPLKAPAEHEPPIPSFVELVVYVVGLSGLGQPLDEAWVHRPERFAALSGLKAGQLITPEALVRVLNHPQGGLKNIPAGARRVILLNQADDAERQALGSRLASQLLPSWEAVLVACLGAEQVFAVNERVGGILLAAGGARRFGAPKQLVEWRGEPLVRHVARQALEAGLWPLVAVSGAYAEAVEAALQGLELEMVYNPDWEAGQSTSLRRGLEALLRLAPQVGAVIFLLADQPGVTPEVLRALRERHAQDLPSILAPLVRGQRANPVLFDRRTFPELLQLRGDQGGRALFSRYSLQYLPWHAETLLWDLDTPEDYERYR